MPSRLTMDKVVVVFEEFGYIPVSKYNGSSENLKVVCPCGHICSISIDRFKRGQRCKECCSLKLRPGLTAVIEGFDKGGFTLCSFSYTNAHVSLRCVCQRGHIVKKSYVSVRSSRGCYKCYQESLPNTGTVSETLRFFGYILIDRKEYKNNYTKVLVMCPSGHITGMTYMGFLRGSRCRKCSSVNRVLPIDVVRKQVAVFGFELLRFSMAKEPVTVKCDKGHTSKMFLYNIRCGHRCKLCYVGDKVSGISQRWLDSLGVEDREVRLKIKTKAFTVDGFDPKTNTIYEFLGDFWHGNPEKFSPEDINPVSKKSFGELHRRTFRRFAKLEEAGYNVIYIWENDFRPLEENNNVR